MVDRIYFQLKKTKMINQFKHIGKNESIHYSSRFKNPKYMSIGNNFYIAQNGIVEAWDKYMNDVFEPVLIIGNDVKINSYCHIGVINRIEIGDGCLFGSHVMLMDHSHGKNSIDEIEIYPSNRRLYSKGPIKIGKKVWLGENAVVLPGVTIGDGAIIGANAVVTKNIPAYCVAAGNPIRIIRRFLYE